MSIRAHLIQSDPGPCPAELAGDPPASWVGATPAEWHAAALARDHYHTALACLRRVDDPSRPRSGWTEWLAKADTHLQAAAFCAQAADLGIDLRSAGEKATVTVPLPVPRDETTAHAVVDADADPSDLCAQCGHRLAYHTVFPAGMGPHQETTVTYAVCEVCTGTAPVPSGPCH